MSCAGGSVSDAGSVPSAAGGKETRRSGGMRRETDPIFTNGVVTPEPKARDSANMAVEVSVVSGSFVLIDRVEASDDATTELVP